MRNRPTTSIASISLCFLLLAGLSSCYISRKMDTYVAEQYGNQLPKPPKKQKADITIKSTIPVTNEAISNTVKKTSQFLPLIVYWSFDYRRTCTLNPAIAVASFSNTINGMSAKLSQKLAGRRLELTVEQAPTAFALVDKAHTVLLVSWDKIYVEPDGKDLIVSYKVAQEGAADRTGKITIKNEERNQGVRFAQSWRSSTGEYLARYNADLVTMSKAVGAKLLEEL